MKEKQIDGVDEGFAGLSCGRLCRQRGAGAALWGDRGGSRAPRHPAARGMGPFQGGSG